MNRREFFGKILALTGATITTEFMPVVPSLSNNETTLIASELLPMRCLLDENGLNLSVGCEDVITYTFVAG